MKLPYVSSLSATFVLGLGLFLAGQLVSSPQAATAMILIGASLLLVVAIRVLASWAGLHQELHPSLEPGEELLVESQDVMAEAHRPLPLGRRGHYRARLTTRRVLLSLKVWWINTAGDVTVGTFAPGQPTSLASVEVHYANPKLRLPITFHRLELGESQPGRVVLQPARKFGSRWTLHVPDANRWREALAASHPELLSLADSRETQPEAQ